MMFCSTSDDNPRSQAMSISLATVLKEWGVHKGSIDRQVSFAMKDNNKTSFKAVIGIGKFKNSKKVCYKTWLSDTAVANQQAQLG